jgi:O-antigen ligase/Tfp pilus assembly protein PilF
MSEMNKSIVINFLTILLPVFGCAFVTSFEILDSSFLPRFIFLSFFLSISVSWLLYNQWNKTDYVIPFDHPITIFMFLWLFASVISIINAINYAEYLAEVQKIILNLTTFLVFAAFLKKNNASFQVSFLKATVVVSIILTVIGAYQFYKYNAIINIQGMIRVTSLMSNKNLFSEYIAICLPFLIAAVITLKRIWKAIAIISTLFVLVFVVILLARSVWVALFASLIFILILIIAWHSVKKVQVTSITKWCFLLSAVIIMLIAFIGLTDNAFDNTIKHRLISIGETDKGSAGRRLQIWSLTIDMIKNSFLNGCGAGNWKLAFPDWDQGSYQTGTEYTIEPLNDYIGIFAESGLFGFVGYVGMLLTGILIFIKLIFSQQSKFPVFNVAALASVIIYCVVSFFNFPKDRIEHSVFLYFLLGFAASAGTSSFVKYKKIISSAILMILLVGVTYSGWCSCQRYLAEKHTRLALEARDKQQWNSVIKEINKAQTPYYPLDPTTTPLIWYRGLAYYTLGKTELAFVDFQSAYKANPFHIHVLNNLATCFELKGDHEQAITLYKEAVRINPYFVDALLNVTAVFYNLKQYDQALLIIERSPQKNHWKLVERKSLILESKEKRENKIP